MRPEEIRPSQEVTENQHPERYRQDGEFIQGTERKASDDSDRITADIEDALKDWEPPSRR
jgi:hypothetical protein